ncbi:hypothetical protein EfmJHP35_31690 (plasmid) [Enterococcus faecium]|nr:hypothetical protein EfmJHP35_31690 [Enterococcus faecium]
MTEIARQKNISTSSVYRVMKQALLELNPFKQTLPKVLKFDWRASFKDYLTESEIADRHGQSHANLDIVENRRLPYLERYFSRFSLATREAVQLIVIDMYAPYVSLVKKLKKFLPQIQNALHYSYSNGPLECLNNHIKVLKRNAYGFRNFYNFKLRIMIRHSTYKKKKQS